MISKPKWLYVCYAACVLVFFGVTKDKVQIHDFQATLLHLLGFDHEKLTFRYQGRDFRLTDVEGQVVKEILA